MGINGFWIYYSKLIKKINIKDITEKIVIVDILLYLHKHIIGIRKSGNDIINSKGKNVSHIYAISKIIKKFADNNILPICVFDGKSPTIKNESIEKCKIIKEKSNIDDSEYIKNFKKSFIIKKDMLIDCKTILEYCGIPYINSIGEADPQCAALQYYYKDIVCGVFSEDSDILLYGANCLFKDLDLKTNTVSVIYREDIINYLQEKTNHITNKFKKNNLIFTNDNFIDFSIIMGNDYCNGIRANSKENKDKLFEIFVLCDFNINLFIQMIYELNNIYKKIIYYVPENFITKSKECTEIYKNIDIINPEIIKINMTNIDNNNITKYLVNNDVKNNTIYNLIYSLKNLEKIFFNKYTYDIINYNTIKNKQYNEWSTVKKK